MARPGRNVVEMVVAKLPPPGEKSSGARKRKKDDEGNVGLESAVEDFAVALGLKAKDVDMPSAVAALKDAITICSHGGYEDDEDEE